MKQSIIADGSKRKLGLDPVVALSLAGAVLFFLISGAVAYFNLRTLRDNNQKIVHSQEVIMALDELFSSAQDAETGQRGFLLTNNEKYLEPYKSAILAIPPRLDEIAQLTSDNLAQKPRIAALKLHIGAKLLGKRFPALEIHSGSSEDNRQRSIRRMCPLRRRHQGKTTHGGAMDHAVYPVQGRDRDGTHLIAFRVGRNG